MNHWPPGEGQLRKDASACLGNGKTTEQGRRMVMEKGNYLVYPNKPGRFIYIIF